MTLLRYTDNEVETVLTANSTAYMFGKDSYYDGPCAYDYDPYIHAEELGLPIITRHLPDPAWVAAYSETHRAIFLKPGINRIVERCAVAHEIVHFEYGDRGHMGASAERRADSVAARRLIRPSRLRDFDDTTDIGLMAHRLDVTEHLMSIFIQKIAK